MLAIPAGYVIRPQGARRIVRNECGLTVSKPNEKKMLVDELLNKSGRLRRLDESKLSQTNVGPWSTKPVSCRLS